MFNTVKQELGTLKTGSTNRIDFLYEDVDYIQSTSSPCDCTTVNNYVTEKKINIIFIPKFPVHLNESSISVVKEVYVTFIDKEGNQQKQTLTITATIIP